MVPVDTDYDDRVLAHCLYGHKVRRGDDSSSNSNAASSASWVPLHIQQLDVGALLAPFRRMAAHIEVVRDAHAIYIRINDAAKYGYTVDDLNENNY